MIPPSRHFVRRRLAAYSLAELMIAMGVLAIALPIITTAFLAGALENANSVDNTMGMLVAENALAMVRARVTHAGMMAEHGTGEMTEPVQIHKDLISVEELEWNPTYRGTTPPVDYDGATYGCVVAVQRLDNDVNDYRLIAVPFRKFQPENKFKDGSLTRTVEDDGRERYKVILKVSETDSTELEEPEEIGFLVQRTALRP